ncbi:MAG: hypothetical protein M3R02_05585, partial [Chloroflexota bacterium]|nr:hypothetical protein [Chloroflexota bacterium]
MSLNPVTCGNCGTENPPDQDVCMECGLPLTGSGDEGLRENLEAQDHGGLLGGGGTLGAAGTLGAGAQPT